jgi:hypothetical protein
MPEKILVVHCKKDPFDIYIGRACYGFPASKWANPFRIKDTNDIAERFRIILEYKQYIRSKPELWNSLPELEGKVLGCWCRPKSPCHGDALLELLEEYNRAILELTDRLESCNKSENLR